MLPRTTEFFMAIGAFLLAHAIPPMPPVRRFLDGATIRRNCFISPPAID
jgi:hypothetical protein